MLTLSHSSTLIALSLVLTLVQSELYQVEKEAQIIQRGSANKKTAGTVYGARSCGGEGKFIHYRIDVCNTTDSPCEYPADGQRRSIEVTFIPTQNVEQLGYRLLASINGSESKVVVDRPLENSSVIGGVEQTVVITGRVPEGNRGSMVTAQNVLFRVADGVTEICAEGDFILV